MKQIFFMIAAVIILFITCLFKPVDIINGVKRLGCESYYVKISAENPAVNGDAVWKYTYLQVGYSSSRAEATGTYR
ncbi:TPA: hypothetical protein IRL80_004810 [Escherichia coli]|nr:hypothetical protein [Escherichia coli]